MATHITASPAITSTQPSSTAGHPPAEVPTSTDLGLANEPEGDGYVPGQSSAKSSFTTRYSQAASFLPASVSSRLPSAEAAEQRVVGLTAKLGVIGGAAAERATHMARSGSERVKAIDLQQYKGKLTPEMMTKCAWSVRNETQVALNVSRTRAWGRRGRWRTSDGTRLMFTWIDMQVSLNQVGPLMYEVLGPNEVFERRW